MKQSSDNTFLVGAGVFALAFGVRLVYLYETSKNPTFNLPIIDSQTYDDLARSLLAGAEMGPKFFWQPFFYPFFLYKLYSFCGGSIICAKLFQMALGAFTCVLTYRIGCKVSGQKTGVLAGIITACYGPLIFFEGELLATGWAAFFSAALVLAALKAREEKKLLYCLVAGSIAGFSVITRPVFLPFIAAAMIWLVFRSYKEPLSQKDILGKVLVLAAGFCIVTGAVAVQSLAATGRFSALPQSGGINLYIGNNPESEKMLAVRPSQWQGLTKLPRRFTSTNKQQDSEFFTARFRAYALKDPAAFLKGLGYKALQFASSREMPRNIDMYVFRKFSRLLSGLVWKFRGFGFPFGVMLPLGVIGLIGYWRKTPGPLVTFIFLYPLAVILVFVSARYRVPVIPVLAVPAAAGVETIVKIIRSGRRLKALLVLAVFGSIISFCSIPGPFAAEQSSYEAEMYHFVGLTYKENGQYAEAIENLTKAIEADPLYKNAYSSLGLVFGEQDQFARAIEYHHKALQIDPNYPGSHNNLGITLAGHRRHEEAIKAFEKAVRIDPYFDKAYYNWGGSLTQLGKVNEAIELYKKVLEIIPRNDMTKNLAWILATYHDEKIRNGTEAVYFAEMLCENSNYKDPGHLYVLAAAYAEAGQFARAVTTAGKALELADKENEKMYQRIARGLELFRQEKTIAQQE
jgi:tetratricopeptide (TPR) repeat protein